MSNAAEAELRLKFVDKGTTGGIDKVAAHVEKITQQTENLVNQSNSRQQKSHERLSLSRESLGARSEKAVRNEVKRTEDAYKSLATSGKAAQDELAQSAEKSQKKLAAVTKELATQAAEQDRRFASYERVSLAREQLGVRSEQHIQSEIKLTELAYRTLEKSGKLSQSELSRAAEKTRQKITALTNEMGRLTREQEKAAKAAKDFEVAQGRIRAGVTAGVGVAAAGYALKAPVMTAMSYDQQLAQTVNTAYPELDAKGRGAMIGGVESIINEAVRKNGGKREGALTTYNNLLSSGEFSNQEAQDLLGLTLKGQTASGASSEDLASIMLAAKHSGVATADMPAALSKAIKAGQLGGFELSDLARHLPTLLSSAKDLGVTGMSGFERILVSAQGSVTTAGTKDEAANNLINILEKINAESTATAFEKHGIDLRQQMTKRMGKGQDAITAFTGLIDELIAKDPNSKATAKRIDELSAGTGRNDPNRRQNLEAIKKITDSSVIGQFLADRQALQGFRAEQFGSRSGLFGRVGGGVSADNGQELQTSFDVMTNRPGFTAERAQEEAAIAQKAAVDKLIPTITRAADMFVDLSQKYPDLSAAVVGATPPIIALGTAAGISAITMGGKAIPAGLMGAAGKVVKYGGGAGLMALGAVVGDYAIDALAGQDSPWSRYGKKALDGAAIGGTVGSVIPGIGTITGAISGALLAIAYEHDRGGKSAPQPIDATANLNIGLAPGLVIQNQNTQSNGLNMKTNVGNTGNIFSGAP